MVNFIIGFTVGQITMWLIFAAVVAIRHRGEGKIEAGHLPGCSVSDEGGEVNGG
jgi:hypothetical protein